MRSGSRATSARVRRVGDFSHREGSKYSELKFRPGRVARRDTSVSCGRFDVKSRLAGAPDIYHVRSRWPRRPRGPGPGPPYGQRGRPGRWGIHRTRQGTFLGEEMRVDEGANTRPRDDGSVDDHPETPPTRSRDNGSDRFHPYLPLTTLLRFLQSNHRPKAEPWPPR